MAFKPKRGSTRPPPVRKHSQVRPAASSDERRRNRRWSSDVEVQILSPIEATASAIDVSARGIQLSFDGWVHTGDLCHLRITTHSGRQIYKRALVVWVRRAGNGCMAGLRVLGSFTPSG